MEEPESTKELAARVATDAGGAFASGLAYLGDRLGLFRALAEAPATADELAQSTGLTPRYVLEWLKGMTASRYVEFDGERFSMTPAQRAVLAEEGGPAFAAAQFQFAVASLLHTPRIGAVFQEGGGVPFDELGAEVSESIDRMHAPAFAHALVDAWLPGVPGLVERLEAGARVLDIGCGLGRSVRALAEAYPRVRITALEPDPASLAGAQELCAGQDNVEFTAATLRELDVSERFDVLLAFDVVHDLAEPVQELRAARELLADDGMFLIVEPTGSTDPRENRNPAGRLRACLSPFHCLTVSLAQGGAGLGTILGEAGIRRLADEAGLSIEALPIENPLQQFFLARR